MVVSHNCEVEKGLLRRPTWPFSIAPLIRIDALPHQEPDFVRRDKFLRYWALPEELPLEEGWAVDLDLVQPTLADVVRAGHRIASIDDRGQKALVGRLLNLVSLREFV
jgi:hypothetical protein